METFDVHVDSLATKQHNHVTLDNQFFSFFFIFNTDSLLNFNKKAGESIFPVGNERLSASHAHVLNKI